jgi:hypothetical protein
VKFSIGSSVDLTDQRLQTLLHLVGDQGVIGNDLYSYRKEKLAFESGRSTRMLNVVHVLKELLGASEDDAKMVAYSLQLSAENAILKELTSLEEQGASWCLPNSNLYETIFSISTFCCRLIGLKYINNTCQFCVKIATLLASVTNVA